MVALSSLGGAGWQFFDNNGVPLSGGKLYTYAAGTTTPATTYTSSNGATPHANPIILDSAGRVASEVWLNSGAFYKFRLDTSADITIWTKDNIPGIFPDAAVSAADVEYDPPYAGALTSGYTVEDKLAQTVSVKDFGAVGNGVADDTAAIVAACAASNSIDFPAGTYKITSTIEPGANKFLNFSNATILSSVAGPAFLIRGNTDVVTFSGDVLIDCQNTAGSVGLKIQATSAIASPATTNTFDQLFVRNASIGVHLYSDGNQGIYYNDFYRVQVLDSTKGIFLETAGGGLSQREVNANHFGMVTLQRCVDALTLNGTWGNYFDFVEAESNTGIAINLVNAFSVGINGGWVEGNTTNLSIGNVPNVYGVYIKASIDSALDSADTKFIYTPSEDRSVIIENSQYARWFGRAGFEERVDIGDYGVAANDQGNSPDGYGRLRVTASQDFFRLSAGSPLFFMRARTGTEGWYFGLDNGSTRLFDLQRSRAVLDTRLALANSAWDKNQLTLGSYYLWVDATGRLRIKSGAPVSDTDGTVVGTQT